MSIFARRPIDLPRVAAEVASAEGWTIERWVTGTAGGPASGGGVSLVVDGGELRGPALLTISAREDGDAASAAAGTESGPGALSGVSEHLPRELPPPRVRGAGGRTLRVRLVEHPSRGTVDDLLSHRAGLTAGEAATVLIAVARGLGDLHASGRAGVLLGTREIALRDNGCPVLTGTAAIRSLDAAAARADAASFAALAATICQTVGGAQGPAVFAAATGGAHRSWDDVIRAVLRAADPVAIGRTPDAAVPAAPHEAAGEALAPAGITGVEFAPVGAGDAQREHADRPEAQDRGSRGALWDCGDVRGGPDLYTTWELEATAVRASPPRSPESSEPVRPWRSSEAAAGVDAFRDIEATLLRGAVRSLVASTSVGDESARGATREAAWGIVEPTARRDEPRGHAFTPGPSDRQRLPTGSPPGPPNSDRSWPDARAASIEATRAPDGSASHAATPTATRRAEARGRRIDGSSRALVIAERLLDEIGDRPVGRALAAARAWAAARPVLVGIAVVPLVLLVLTLILMPAERTDDDVVGQRSPALLRESGTGPDCVVSELVAQSGCGG